MIAHHSLAPLRNFALIFDLACITHTRAARSTTATASSSKKSSPGTPPIGSLGTVRAPTPDDDISEILSQELYLSGRWGTEAREELTRRKIRAVLTVADLDVTRKFPGISYKRIPMADSPSADLVGALPECVSWIDAHIREKRSRVLVHCEAGSSRSASVVIGYLMSSQGLGLPEAWGVVLGARPNVAPNPGFAVQLYQFQGGLGRDGDVEAASRKFLLDYLRGSYALSRARYSDDALWDALSLSGYDPCRAFSPLRAKAVAAPASGSSSSTSSSSPSGETGGCLVQ